MRRAFLALAICLYAAPALAQEVVARGPVTATMKFAWTAHTSITTPADAQGFEWRVKDGATPLTALTAVTCTLAAGLVSCQSPLGQSQADALNRVGVHTLTLASFRADVGESQASPPFILTSPQGASTDFRIIR
jgi:hypothetical protein